MLKYEAYGNEYDIYFEIGEYYGTDNTAVRMYCVGEYGYEPFANMTVNIPMFVPVDKRHACLDVNNLHGIADWVEKNNLGTPTGMTVSSGWCEYPVYVLNIEEIKKHMLEGVKA